MSAALELLRGFLNTRDLETGRDDLDEPRALERWLADHGLDPAGSVGEDSWTDALHLRESLRAVALAHHDRSTPPERGAVAEVNRLADAARLRLELDGDGSVRLVPAPGERAELAGLLAAFVEVALEGSWERLKICPADDCQWAFVDRSRNRSRTWCSMEVCGARAKARAYRARRRDPAGGAPGQVGSNTAP